jgi:hypothetical protein
MSSHQSWPQPAGDPHSVVGVAADHNRAARAERATTSTTAGPVALHAALTYRASGPVSVRPVQGVITLGKRPVSIRSPR